jgi:putative NADH-flavin reductase
MKIALFGATGRTGRYALQSALADGHAVSVLVRNPAKLPPGVYRLTMHLGNVTDADAVEDTLFGQEAVLSTLGMGDDPQSRALSTGIANIVQGMRANKLTRLVVVAGAGILLDRKTGAPRMDSPTFPAAYRPYAEEHRRVYDLLQATDLDWTLVCPPTMRDEPPSGTLRAAEDCLPEGGKTATYADVARFAYSLLSVKNYSRQRVGVAE